MSIEKIFKHRPSFIEKKTFEGLQAALTGSNYAQIVEACIFVIARTGVVMGEYTGRDPQGMIDDCRCWVKGFAGEGGLAFRMSEKEYKGGS